MKPCSNKDLNAAGCACTYPGCPRHGVCCECVAYHRGKGQIPGCFFPPGAEKEYDRSVEFFLKAHG